jgi:hypothetical protein
VKATYVLTIGLALSLLAAGLVQASNGVQRPREVLSGGASASSAPGLSLRATLGQPVVGTVSDWPVTLGQGFWGGTAQQPIFLPVALRGA